MPKLENVIFGLLSCITPICVVRVQLTIKSLLSLIYYANMLLMISQLRLTTTTHCRRYRNSHLLSLVNITQLVSQTYARERELVSTSWRLLRFIALSLSCNYFVLQYFQIQIFTLEIDPVKLGEIGNKLRLEILVALSLSLCFQIELNYSRLSTHIDTSLGDSSGLRSQCE